MIPALQASSPGAQDPRNIFYYNIRQRLPQFPFCIHEQHCSKYNLSQK